MDMMRWPTPLYRLPHFLYPVLRCTEHLVNEKT
nr:MAG TPA: hypothetical protein [Caudoviricetes sp.]